MGWRSSAIATGRNIAVEHRWAEGELDRQDELAAELVRLKVDVIIAAGGVARCARRRRRPPSVPIVMTIGPDSWPRAGSWRALGGQAGTLPGCTRYIAELGASRLELLREMLPDLERVGVSGIPAVPTAPSELKNTQLAARPLRLAIQSLEVRQPR